jgi:uncharacterized coiled-coil protein SlyX
LKNNQPEMNSSNKSLVNRVEQVENRVSGTEDKLKELNEIVKNH